MKNISTPIIYEFDYSKEIVAGLESQLENEQHKKYLLRFPTVYIVNDKVRDSQYSVYIGETTNIKRRTLEHLKGDSKARDDWEKLAASNLSLIHI